MRRADGARSARRARCFEPRGVGWPTRPAGQARGRVTRAKRKRAHSAQRPVELAIADVALAEELLGQSQTVLRRLATELSTVRARLIGANPLNIEDAPVRVQPLHHRRCRVAHDDMDASQGECPSMVTQSLTRPSVRLP